jgi:hypothetical protein
MVGHVHKIMGRLLCVAAAVGGATCGQHELDKSALYIPADAVSVHSSRGFGSNGAEYVIEHADSTAIVRNVSQHLAEAKWVPTSPLWDDLESASSYVSGWYCFPERETVTYQWTTDWRNAAGDIATYIIKTHDVNSRGQLEILVSIVRPSSVSGSVQPVHAEHPNGALSVQCQTFLKTLQR